MDPIKRNQSLYEKLSREISLFLEIFTSDRTKASVHLKQMGDVARQIDPAIYRDIKQLEEDYQSANGNQAKIGQEALRIKQEVREL